MRLIGLLPLTLCLAGCGGPVDSGPSPRHGGRYVGIGIYSPDAMWKRLAGVQRSEDRAAATLDDDEQVIVVVDSQTGEIRQCGNLSGHCLRMNPWSAQPAAPAGLTQHRADLAREAAIADEPEAATNAAAAPAASRR